MASSKIFIRIVSACLLLSLIVGLSYVKSRTFSYNKNRSTMIPGECTTLIIGDSHAASDMNPDFIEKSINTGQSAENVCFSFYGLRKLLNSNPAIRNVMIAYSYHSLISFQDYEGIEDAEMMHRYHTIVDGDFYRIYFKNERWSLRYYIKYICDTFSLPIGLANDLYVSYTLNAEDFLNYPWIGGFNDRTASKIGNRRALQKTLNRHFFDGKQTRHLSNVKVSYFKNLVSLCKRNNVKLYIVNTPVHREYYEQIPIKVIEFTDELANAVSDSNVVYLNLSKMDMPDGLFFDYDHLNRSGAEIFSKLLNRIVNGKGH